MDRQLTCIICPRGCTLRVTAEEGGVLSVSGNACPRGAAYAEQECTHPMRTVTTTVRTKDGEVVAAKTAAPVPKEKMRDVMDAVALLRAPAAVRIGDVLCTDIAGTGVSLVATANKDL